MAPSIHEFPERLAESDSRGAALIERALSEPVVGPSEQQSWHRLQARLGRSPTRWIWPVAAFAVVGVALLAWWGKPKPAPVLSPEIWLPKAAAPPSAAPVPSALDVPVEPAPAPRVDKPPASASASATAGGDTSACAQLARGADYEAAATCYGKVARGSSMTSELALYEKARLESKALGRSQAALATLDEHARRFAGGVLTTEVGLTRIELLSQLGRSAEALSAIEKGMHGALGRERGGDLLVLRAELLATQGSCVAALEAAQQARDKGAHPSRLEAAERRCASNAPEAAPAAAASEGGQ
jgi:hypothetical protein